MNADEIVKGENNLPELLRIIAYPSVYRKDLEAAADLIETLQAELHNAQVHADCMEAKALAYEAERDGRLVVLPCKVGDTVYLVLPKCRASRIPLAECSFFECDDCPRNKREIFEQKATTEMLSIMLFEKYNTLYVFGKTVFLTREEAEAALEKEAQP